VIAADEPRAAAGAQYPIAPRILAVLKPESDTAIGHFEVAFMEHVLVDELPHLSVALVYAFLVWLGSSMHECAASRMHV
jgi:hypothetical protein